MKEKEQITFKKNAVKKLFSVFCIVCLLKKFNYLSIYQYFKFLINYSSYKKCLVRDIISVKQYP